ncbi:MAG: hypothetical protein U1E77_07555 [Inhella sp.]
MRVLATLTVTAALLGASAPALSEGMRFNFSGFGQYTVGKVLSGDKKPFSLTGNWNCPCAIANWEYVGVYEKDKGWQADQESLIGLQGTLHFSDSISATAQVLARPGNFNFRPTLDWAYGSWAVNDHWTVQAGRKRIPLYYYSDFLYIGTAYPWVRPPQDVYGWPIYAYDGVNAAYSGQWGSVTVDANVWAGGFTHNNAPYNTKIYYGAKTNEKWKGIHGAYITLTKDEWNGRVMVMRHKANTWTPAYDDQPETVWVPNLQTTIIALSLNYDGANWLLRSELNRFKQDTSKAQYDYYLLGVGYRVGDWTAMLTQSNYKTKDLGTAFGNPPQGIEARRSRSLALRYDLNKNWALKGQYDVSKDRTTWYDFFGDHKMLTFSAQTSF